MKHSFRSVLVHPTFSLLASLVTVVHSGKFNLLAEEGNGNKKKPDAFFLPYEREFVRMRNLWNDPDAEEGEYSVRVKISRVGSRTNENPILMLTHLYWSV